MTTSTITSATSSSIELEAPAGLPGLRAGPAAEPEPEGLDSRQSTLVPPDRLAAYHCAVIGVGAVGRALALQLASMGASELSLYDKDRVEVANRMPQGWGRDDLGREKVVCVAEEIERRHEWCKTTKRCFFYTPGDAEALLARAERAGRRLAVFACADRMDARRAAWETLGPAAGFFADARVAAETVTILAGPQDPRDDSYYPRTLFDQSEAYEGRCTDKMTIYLASLAAGLMLAQFSKHLRGCPVDRSTTYNALANDHDLG